VQKPRYTKINFSTARFFKIMEFVRIDTQLLVIFMLSNHLANFHNPIDHQSVQIRVHFATHNCILEALNFTTGHLLNFPSSQSDASSSPINKTKTDSLLEHSRLLCCCSTFFLFQYIQTRAPGQCVFQVANAAPAFLIHDPRESKKDNGDRPIVASGAERREKEKSVGRPLGLRCKGVGGWQAGWHLWTG
jgi:hypothetical protein